MATRLPIDFRFFRNLVILTWLAAALETTMTYMGVIAPGSYDGEFNPLVVKHWWLMVALKVLFCVYFTVYAYFAARYAPTWLRIVSVAVIVAGVVLPALWDTAVVTHLL